MRIPNQISKLYMRKYRQNKRNLEPAQIHPRLGEFTEPQQLLSLLNEEDAKVVLGDWYEFHLAADHKSYEDFFSKVLYCKQLTARSAIDADAFLSLIADRTFLFLEYNRSASSLEYPELSGLVESPQNYIDENDASKCDLVLQQGLIPTQAHKAARDIWQRNLKVLRNARDRRVRMIAAGFPDPIPFKVEINDEQRALSDIEKQLCHLFHAYVLACKNMAYVEWTPPSDEKIEILVGQPIHNLWKHLQKQKSPLPGYRALVFFHFFSQNGAKLLSGELQCYKFNSCKARSNYDKPPDQCQRRVSERIRCNILLYDQLLELLYKKELRGEGDKGRKAPDTYRQRANFVFYVFSRFDQYWHFDLTDYWGTDGNPQIHFNYKEDYENGVDDFGNLLRRHTYYCLPISAQWLVPVLSGNKQEPPMSVLATMLLAETEGLMKIPVASRLTRRIQRFLDEPKKGKEALRQYEDCYLDDYLRRKHLEEWRDTEGLYVTYGAELFETQGQQYVSQKVAITVLDYALKLRMYQDAFQNLEIIAKHFFDNLCLGNFSGRFPKKEEE